MKPTHCLECHRAIPEDRRKWGNVRFCGPICSRASTSRQVRDKRRGIMPDPPRPNWGNPKPEPQHEDEPDLMPKVRRLDCAKYDACLEWTCSHSLDGFNCRSCTDYEREKVPLHLSIERVWNRIIAVGDE